MPQEPPGARLFAALERGAETGLLFCLLILRTFLAFLAFSRSLHPTTAAEPPGRARVLGPLSYFAAAALLGLVLTAEAVAFLSTLAGRTGLAFERHDVPGTEGLAEGIASGGLWSSVGVLLPLGLLPLLWGLGLSLGSGARGGQVISCMPGPPSIRWAVSYSVSAL